MEKKNKKNKTQDCIFKKARPSSYPNKRLVIQYVQLYFRAPVSKLFGK